MGGGAVLNACSMGRLDESGFAQDVVQVLAFGQGPCQPGVAQQAHTEHDPGDAQGWGGRVEPEHDEAWGNPKPAQSKPPNRLANVQRRTIGIDDPEMPSLHGQRLAVFSGPEPHKVRCDGKNHHDLQGQAILGGLMRLGMCEQPMSETNTHQQPSHQEGVIKRTKQPCTKTRCRRLGRHRGDGGGDGHGTVVVPRPMLLIVAEAAVVPVCGAGADAARCEIDDAFGAAGLARFAPDAPPAAIFG